MSYVYLALVAAALLWMDVIIGGTRLVFALPAYALLALASLLSLSTFASRRRSPPDPLCVGSTLLLGAWVLFRAWGTEVWYLGWDDFYSMLACLMVYLLTAVYFTGSRRRLIVLMLLWGIAAAELWYGLIQFKQDPAAMPFGFSRGVHVTRASGMFISPNHFAGFLETVAIITASLAVWSSWRVWLKGLALYIAACCWFGVVISGSRGGYFSTLASIVTLGLASLYTLRLAEPHKVRMVAVVFSAGLAVAVGLAVFAMLHNELLEKRLEMITQKDVRIYNWQAALDHIRVSPWIGTGAGTHLIYGRLYRRPPIQADPVHAHCDYLELLAEYGIAGGVCMALFLVAHFRRGLAGFSYFLRQRLLVDGYYRSTEFALQLGLLSALAALTVHSIVDFNMHIPGNAMLYAFIFGVLANPGLERKPGVADHIVYPLARLAPVAAAAGVILLGLPLLPSQWLAEQARSALRDGKLRECVDLVNRALGQPTAAPDWVDDLVKRCGGANCDPYVYFYKAEANRGLGLRMPMAAMRRPYYQAAIATCDEGLKIFPRDENLLTRKAQALDGLRRFDEAEACYKEALALDPNFGQIWGYYGSHLLAEGKKEASDAAYARAREITNVELKDLGRSELGLQ